MALRPAVFDRYILTLNIAHFAEALPKADKTARDVYKSIRHKGKAKYRGH
jgi:hypothetical protein